MQGKIFGKLKNNSTKIQRNAEKLSELDSSLEKGTRKIESLDKEVTELKNNDLEHKERIDMLQNQINCLLEFKENGEIYQGASSVSKIPAELDQYTRAAWYQQHLIASRKFSRAVTQSENLGYIHIDIREFTDQLIFREQNPEQFKFNSMNFRRETGADVEALKVWQKTSG